MWLPAGEVCPVALEFEEFTSLFQWPGSVEGCLIGAKVHRHRCQGTQGEIISP
jgi:hypothetical protein